MPTKTDKPTGTKEQFDKSYDKMAELRQAMNSADEAAREEERRALLGDLAVTETFGALDPEAALTERLRSVMDDESARQNALSKADILTEAIGVTANRNESYDAPEDNFQRIADLWTAFAKGQGKDITFTAQDVSMYMMLMKLGRLAFNPTHHDSIVDVAGYAGCAGQIASIERIKNNV